MRTRWNGRCRLDRGGRGDVADLDDVVCPNVQPRPFAWEGHDPLPVAPGYDTFALMQAREPAWPYATDHVHRVREACRLNLLSRDDVCGRTDGGCARGATCGEKSLGDQESYGSNTNQVDEHEEIPLTLRSLAAAFSCDLLNQTASSRGRLRVGHASDLDRYL